MPRRAWEWTAPTMFAPLHGAGAPAVRDRLAQLGAPGVICAPFLRITGQPPNLAWLLGQVHRSASIPLSVQLLGSHAGHLALAAKVLGDAGVDVVDLNLGCPSRQVVRKGAGAALLSRLDQISRIVGTMRAACGTRLSVKIRASDDSSDDVVDIARAIEVEGADFLVVHPRTRSQGYRGVADWNIVQRVKSKVTIPVVGNGDAWYASDALRLLRTSGADGIMIGRPALRNPFIFRQLAELLAGHVPYVPRGVDIFEHIEYLARAFDIELRRTSHGPAGALKEQIQFLLRAVPAPWGLPILEHAMRAVGMQEVIEAIRPLRDLELLDLAADGPHRLETTPPDPG